MNTIPTAEEFFETWLIKKGYIALQGFEQLDQDDLSNYAIEFAKLHVKAALQAAYENAEADGHYSEDYDEYIDTIIDQDSILNAYPLDQIK
jgi:hypothetical protein